MTTVSSSQSVQQNDRGVSGVHSGGMDDDDKFEEIQTRYNHVVQRYHLLRWWHRLDVPIVHRYTTTHCYPFSIILQFYNAFFSFNHTTTFSGTLIVESRPCRTNAQSSNKWLSLISCKVIGWVNRRINSISTTQLLESSGSGRGSETTRARPTIAASLWLW